MMLLAELARQEGLFDWLAALAVEHARGSPQRLFTLVYLVGTVVTVFLSNDATAVVLTPAVYAATRAANATPLPYLLVCAFVASAASFVLPISNPANLVVFGGRMPHLLSWLAQFGIPSLVAIGTTYIALRLTQRKTLLQDRIARAAPRPQLGPDARMTGYGILATSVVLLACSALELRLGLPTFLCGCIVAGVVLVCNRQAPWAIVRGISWGVLPLVAGLFVLVQGLDHTGVIPALRQHVVDSVHASSGAAAWQLSLLVALACNFLNNLPVGLIAGSVLAADHVPAQVAGSVLLGVDLGPNLSVTGSLATVLWLVAMRREGQDVTGWLFLRFGLVVMPPALLLSVAALNWLPLYR
jgi:arsenical pump membrane protein